ncbi:MAG: YwaF family protein [Lachnospiraceae bacterium]|nr:YwaF family protein [Lachnospiraceae bacterium]
MYSTAHIIFIIISLLMAFVGVLIVEKKKIIVPDLIKVCFIIALFCEIVKIFTIIEIVPIVESVIENGSIVYKETGRFSPYIKAEHLPFELCSYQIIFLFLARVVKNEVWKRRIYSFIYVTALIGGALAIFISPIAPGFKSTSEFLLSLRAWEFYIYHAMLIVIAISIARDKNNYIRFTDVKWTCIILLLLDLLSFYMNSIFSVPVYKNNNLIGLQYAVNYFSSYNNQFGIVMATKSQYIIYIVFRFVLAIICIFAIYLPFLFKEKKHRHGK